MWLHVGFESASATRLDHRFVDPAVFRVWYRVRHSHLERVSENLPFQSQRAHYLFCALSIRNRGQRTKKTAEVEKKLRKALGMDSQEGSIDEAEKTSSSAPRKADTRSSVDSYNNGEAGSGSSGSPEDRDSQRLLPVPTHTATECEVPEGQRDTQAEIGGEEYEMMEKQSIARRKDGL